MVHVLVTSVVAMVIAAGLMRVLMMRYVAIQRVQDGGTNRRAAEGAVNQIIGVWNRNGAVCSNAPMAVTSANFSYSGSPTAGVCSCTLNGSGVNAGTTVIAAVSGGACRLQSTSGS